MAATIKMDDSVLGAALTKGLASGTSAGACPPLESIAELVDGSSTGDERDRLLGHLARCEGCRATFLASSELVNGRQGVAVEGMAGQGAKRRSYLFPSALAAAAVFVIALTLQLLPLSTDKVVVARNAEPAVPPAAVAGSAGKVAAPTDAPAEVLVARRNDPEGTAGRSAATGTAAPDGSHLARLLAQDSDPGELASLAAVQEKTFGFAAGGDAESLAFRTGVALMNLELALLADDGDLAEAQAARLSPLFEQVAGDPGVAELERMVAGLEQGRSAGGMKGNLAKLERLVPRVQVPYLRLGAWTRGARLAVATGNRAYLAAGVPRYFSGNLAGAAVPPQAAAALRDLDRQLKPSGSVDPELVEKDLALVLEAF